jgi:hypothetical protein
MDWRPETTATVLPPPNDGDPVRAHFVDKNGTKTEDFELVVFAAGFNLETMIDAPSGKKISPYFWEDDDYADPTVNQAGKDFAIVGMGDGALQDFLRLVFDPGLRCAHDILTRIRLDFVRRVNAALTARKGVASISPRGLGGPLTAGTPLHGFGEKVWRQLEHAISDIDRQTTLASPWDSYSGRGLSDLHADVTHVVDQAGTAFPSELAAAVDTAIRKPALKSITFFAPAPSPSKCYMLNRFLYTLIRWRVSRANSATTLRIGFVPGRLGQSNVTYVPGKYRISLPVIGSQDFDRVVWRVGPGTQQPTSLVEGLRVAVAKHALPYYPPDRFR